MINPNSISLGMVVNCKPFPWVAEGEITSGEVVYIHPDKRFFTVKFVTKSGKEIRESFSFNGPQTVTPSKGK